MTLITLTSILTNKPIQSSLNSAQFLTTSFYNDGKKMNETKEQWVTVFIHGTCASGLALISLTKVLLDKTDKTLYQKIHRGIRKQHWFAGNNFGLLPIDLKKESDAPYPDLAYYIIKTYRSLELASHEAKTNHDFYLFGWNGMLSQTERSKESVRLYNELASLIAQYKSFNITPKIRLVCYSHGGNVALNLGAIHSVLTNTTTPFYTTEQLNLMTSILAHDITSSHDFRPEASQWYKKPTNTTLQIDELILYATPIHQETESFCTSPLFKRVVNLYSENDTIQPSDIMTTQFRHCKQVLDKRFLQNQNNNIVQVKIMINRTMQKNDQNEQKTATLNYREQFSKTKKLVSSMNISAAMRGGNPMHEYHEDLTHTDFWWVSFRTPELFFTPLPFVIFTPVILQALDNAAILDTSTKFFDLNVTTNTTEDTATFSLYLHDNPTELVSEQKCSLQPVTIMSEQVIKEKKNLIKH